MQKLSLTTIKGRLRKINPTIVLLSTKYEAGNLPLKCLCMTCRHKWNVKWDNLRCGRGCPLCGRKRASDKKRTKIETIRSRLAKITPLISLLTVDYESGEDLLLLRCKDCKETWQAELRKLNQGFLTRCRKCTPHKFGVREEEVRRAIERITGWKFPKTRPEWLRGRSRHAMELDGYNKTHKVAFEYQGRPHYEPLKVMGGTKAFKQIRRNDERKRVLCYNKGVTLIRIPHWKRDVEGFIRSKLHKAGYF